MDINLKVATSRLFPKSRFEMIYFEAVANALDAGATVIDIDIVYRNSDFERFTIIDNGCGLNDENYNRFSELMEAKDNAHKGQGRLVYLVYFENIEIISQFRDSTNNTKKREFYFNYNFDKEYGGEVEQVNGEINKEGTKLSFSGKLKDLYRMKSIQANHIKHIKEEILAEFLPCLYKMKQKGIDLIINIRSHINDEECVSIIDVNDIPEFHCKSFPTIELIPENGNGAVLRDPNSYLYYSIRRLDNEEQPSIVTSFAIDNRAKKIEIFDRSNYLPGAEAVFFLTSKHFEGCIDPTRQELTLENKEMDAIERTLKRYIREILENEFESEYKANVEQQSSFVENRFPHLMGYIDNSELGFQSTEKVVQSAQSKFFRKQFGILKKEKISEDDYEEIIELSARNLAEYILFRQIQIDALLEINNKNSEYEIHDTITPIRKIIYAEDKKSNLFKNNAWILDDRFMSYLHSASDISLQKITESFDDIFYKESGSEERPDYLMFFSNKLDKEDDKLNLVCFEFKKLGNTKYDKSKAIIQLTDYAVELKDTCKQIDILFLFALVEFDEKFEKTLKAQGFKRRFSIQGTIWSRYNPDIDVELSFLDFKALIHDANSRNNTFMEILKNGFSYQ